ncbi:MAG: serine protease [Rhodobacterales bacterium]|nr:serine protease [Rhodobacterales bacterium]
MTFRPFAAFLLCLVVLTLALPRHANAQDGTVWIQIEAQPDLTGAEDRARAYAALFPETGGFRLRSGWYGIMLGPYQEAEGRLRLATLKRDGMIPADSFIAFERDFGDRFWPPSGVVPVVPEVTAASDPALADPALADPAVQPDLSLIPDETLAEARDSEVLLTPEDRMDLQTALQWFGFYQGSIDGAFGAGTRNSMAAWQEAQGVLGPTGTLTSRQRAELMTAYRSETAAFGFAEVAEAEAGITVSLPLGLVEFDHYEPPFVHFRARDGSGLQIVLISQPGDQAALSGLYDVIQTLDPVPLSGDRSRGERSFRIRGTSDRFDTTAYAELTGGFIKGWMVISSPGNEARDARIITGIEASFTTDDTRALDPGMVAMDSETRAGLLAGIEVRTPRLSRSGLFISTGGAVLTTTEAVTGCARITIDRVTEARVAFADAASGLALLTPVAPLSPRAVAEFQLAPERVGTEVMVAGYSYEDRLPAPVMTFGTLEDLTGLNGEAGQKRLSVEALPGDAGGPVLDATGAVIGMLLSKGGPSGKTLPADVHFAVAAAEIVRLVEPAGVTPLVAGPKAALPPSDLATLGTGMTVLVSCWD